jgi:hypothetical protein
MQPTRFYASQFIYFNKKVLQVSGGSSAHHQELKLHIQLVVFVKSCCYLLLLAAGSSKCWPALVNMIMSIRVWKITGNLLNS